MKVHMHDDIAQINPHGWLMGDRETDELDQTIEQLHASGNRRLIIDLSDTEMINSTALAVFVRAKKRYDASGGRLALCSVDKRINNIFVMTKLSIFEVYAHAKAALEALATQPAR